MIYKCLLMDNVYITYARWFKHRFVVLGEKVIMGSMAYDDFNLFCARRFQEEYRRHPVAYWFRLAGHLITTFYYRLMKRPLSCYYNIWPYNEEL